MNRIDDNYILSVAMLTLCGLVGIGGIKLFMTLLEMGILS